MLRTFVNCEMVLKKRLNFFYFQWEKVDQVRSEYLRSYLNWLHNWQLKSRRRSQALKGSHSMGDERIFLKTGRDADFNKDYRMSLISTGSILLDSTFNILCRGFKMKCFTIFDQKSVNFFHILSYLILVWIRIRIQQNTRIRMQCIRITYCFHHHV